jgi:hypothetical protein
MSEDTSDMHSPWQKASNGNVCLPHVPWSDIALIGATLMRAW